MPTNTPISDQSGPVFQLVSAHNPSAANPSVGTNILQVVSSMVASNKTTVEFFGGLGVPLGVSFGSLMYTIYTTKQL